MKLQLLILLTLSMLMAACGKSNSKGHSYKQLNPISPEFMAEVINRQLIWCAEKDHCIEGIGRMFAVSSDSKRATMACSAVLIKSDVVLTNSHCVYTGKISLAETCERLFFAFPNQEGVSQPARCSKILWRDKNQQGSDHYRKGDNDFALIKLDTTLSVAPLKLAKDGMRRGAKVFPTVVDQLDAHHAQIVRLECTVRGVTSKHGVSTLSDCPIISGNSGAPVLDEHKNIVGLVFASSDTKIRSPRDDLSTRKVAPTVGYAFSTDHLERVLGSLLN